MKYLLHMMFPKSTEDKYC